MTFPRTTAPTLVAQQSGSAVWAIALARAAGGSVTSALLTSSLGVGLALIGVFEHSTSMALGDVMLAACCSGC